MPLAFFLEPPFSGPDLFFFFLFDFILCWVRLNTAVGVNYIVVNATEGKRDSIHQAFFFLVSRHFDPLDALPCYSGFIPVHPGLGRVSRPKCGLLLHNPSFYSLLSCHFLFFPFLACRLGSGEFCFIKDCNRRRLY